MMEVMKVMEIMEVNGGSWFVFSCFLFRIAHASTIHDPRSTIHLHHPHSSPSSLYPKRMLSAICALVLAQTPQYIKPYAPSGTRIEVVMENGGRFVITTDPKASPKTIRHILDLVDHKFYDRQRVHRVEYWVTQWGDPASRTKPMNDPKMGDGDSGHRLAFEMSDIDFTRGVVGVASDGLQNGGDSQLFVIKSNRLYLYHSYAVVGKVTKGMEVVDRIKKGDRIKSMRVIPPTPLGKDQLIRVRVFPGTPYKWKGGDGQDR
jgi:peptidylprolyl isomerase